MHKIYLPRLEELSELERELFELYLETSDFKKPAHSNHQRDYIKNYVRGLIGGNDKTTILDLGCGMRML